MIKKLFGVIVGVLALNFLAAAGGVGYLVATKKLDKTKVHDIRDLLAGVVVTTQPATSQPATQPVAQETPADESMLRLNDLLAKASGRPANEQITLVQNSFDAQNAILERRLREVQDQRQQIQQARLDLQTEREKLEKQQKSLVIAQQQQQKLASDEGFQKSLALYQSLPAKKVKELFAAMDPDTVVRYLQAMDERQAAGVLKEYKTPEETIRAQAILEKIRQAQAKAD